MNRKEAILGAATRLFAGKGFASTPTSEIAKVAGVAEGTIFHYFKSKDEILMEIFEDLMNRYVEGLASAIGKTDTGMHAVEKFVRFHFRFIRGRSEQYLIVIRDFPSHLVKSGSPQRRKLVKSQSHVVGLIRDCLRRGKGDGSIRSDVPEEKTSLIIRGILHGVSRQTLLGPMKIPDLEEEIVRFSRRSLANQDATLTPAPPSRGRSGRRSILPCRRGTGPAP